MTAHKFLVTGGYGLLGKDLCPMMLDHYPGSTLIIAGRSLDKATAYCNDLNCKYPNRVTPACIDIGSLKSLEAAPDFTVLVNLMTVAKVTGKWGGNAAAMAEPTVQIMKFAVSRNAAYIDVDSGPLLVKDVWKEVEKMMGGPVPPVILPGAGFMPGMNGIVMRKVALPLHTRAEVWVELAASIPPGDGMVDDAYAALPMMSPAILQDGVWQKTGMTLDGKADLGTGKQYTRSALGFAADIEPLTNELGCKKSGVVSCMDTSAPGLGYMITGALGALVLNKFPLLDNCFPFLKGWSKACLKKFYVKGYDYNPTLAIMQGRAIGADEAGKKKESIVRISCLEGEHAMAAYAVIAQLNQILDGTIKGHQPVRWASLATDPEKFMDFFKSLGPNVMKIDECCNSVA